MLIWKKGCAGGGNWILFLKMIPNYKNIIWYSKFLRATLDKHWLTFTFHPWRRVYLEILVLLMTTKVGFLPHEKRGYNTYLYYISLVVTVTVNTVQVSRWHVPAHWYVVWQKGFLINLLVIVSEFNHSSNWYFCIDPFRYCLFDAKHILYIFW